MIGYLEVLGAVLIWALINGLIIKKVNASAVAVGTWMSVVGVVIFLALFHQMPMLSREQTYLLCTLGLVAALNNSFFYTALKKTEVYNAALVHYFASPLAVGLVMFAPIAAIHESATMVEVAAVLIGFIGLVFIAGPNLKGKKTWLYYAVASAMFYSVEMVVGRLISKGNVDPNVTAFAKLFGQMMLMPIVGLCIGQSIKVSERKDWPKLIIAGVLLFLSFVLIFSGMKTVPVKHVAVLGYVDRLGAIALGAYFFKERLTRNIWIGGGLIILADVLLAFFK